MRRTWYKYGHRHNVISATTVVTHSSPCAASPLRTWHSPKHFHRESRAYLDTTQPCAAHGGRSRREVVRCPRAHSWRVAGDVKGLRGTWVGKTSGVAQGGLWRLSQQGRFWKSRTWQGSRIWEDLWGDGNTKKRFETLTCHLALWPLTLLLCVLIPDKSAQWREENHQKPCSPSMSSSNLSDWKLRSIGQANASLWPIPGKPRATPCRLTGGEVWQGGNQSGKRQWCSPITGILLLQILQKHPIVWTYSERPWSFIFVGLVVNPPCASSWSHSRHHEKTFVAGTALSWKQKEWKQRPKFKQTLTLTDKWLSFTET